MADQLDEYSAKILRQIAAHFPEWASIAKIEEGEDGDTALALTIIPPSTAIVHPLRIDTWGEEVTVSIENYHAHFLEFDEGAEDDAVTFVKRVVSDKFGIVSYWRDEQWCGSFMLSENDLPIDNSDIPYANKIKIRSWAGSLDDEIECDPRG